MTPAARYAAAIQILDGVLAGQPAEKLLTTWGRQNRFAGSGDRGAIRDIVFDGLRALRSHAALGGGDTGRGVILGGLREAGIDPRSVFTGQGYAPAPLSDTELALSLTPDDLPPAVALDCPDWLMPLLQDSLGDDFRTVMQALRQRAPVFLRANLRKVSRDQAQAALAADGITTVPHPLSPTALMVQANARKVQASGAYQQGLVELQDAGSQAVSDMIPVEDGQSVLDFCAGGGGKTLALAGRARARFHAHDENPQRLCDLPARAERAGVDVALVVDSAQGAPHDVVICDVPCSGSGAWRRSPEAKWRLTPATLKALMAVQAGILDQAAPLVRTGGRLAYVTCSLLRGENRDQLTAFLARNKGWSIDRMRELTPLDGGDGFFVGILSRA